MLKALRIKNGRIVDADNKAVKLCGVNFGGWLMMEGYILGGRNIPEHLFRQQLAKNIGQAKAVDFIRKFRENFISEDDLKQIKRWGMNCVRLPINYRLIYECEGLDFLAKVIGWFRKNKVYIILDLHAAPGSQNHDWHSDSAGQARLWENQKYQAQTVQVWEVLSERFKDEAAIAGYDLINESVLKATKKLVGLYKRITRAIRLKGDQHIIFLEANQWAQDFKGFGLPDDAQTAYSIHFYQPLSFVFNFHPNLQYPGKISGQHWDRERLLNVCRQYSRFSAKTKRPVLVGEFGVNSRCGQCHPELKWLEDALFLFKELDFHWTYWTYKAVAGAVFPDGILRLRDNFPWVRREGPLYGWENIPHLDAAQREQAAKSYQSKNFKEEAGIVELLKKYAE